MKQYLRQPPSELMAIAGEKALHVFDKTNSRWYCVDELGLEK